MPDLVGYDSSDEEIENQKPFVSSQTLNQEISAPIPRADQKKDQNKATALPTGQLNEPSYIPINSPPAGPVLGPAARDMAPVAEEKNTTSGRSSPFSASRALVQDLTLPPVPNLDIPPSPPGSPNPAANAKFEHFLSLKKQGVHFNSKLSSSTSLKNPSLLANMMTHAGITEQSQYDTSLPADVWSTAILPQWGFKEELLRTQHEMRQNMEEQKASGQRTSVDFVSGSV